MTREELRQLAEAAKKKNPKWFELEQDGPATEAAICVAEGTLDVVFSTDYRDFLREYGGGYFAFVLVLGVEPDAPWSIVRMNENPRLSGFLTLLDSGTGDLYGHSVGDDGRCQNSIDIIDHERGAVLTGAYSDFYEMVAQLGLKP